MPGNRGVSYKGPGNVEVHETDYPEFELKDGPGSTRPTWAARYRTARSSRRRDQHLRQRPAHGPRPHHRPVGPDPRPRDHRRGGRDRSRRGVHQGGRPRVRAVQHRLRPLPQLQGGQDRRLRERQPRPARARRTATSTWAAGSAARPSTCWCPTPTGTCSSSLTRTRRWRRSSTWPCSRTSSRPASTAA